MTSEKKSLASRIQEAHADRQRQADEKYAETMRQRDARHDSIRADTIERHSPGVEPMWLLRAKRLHHEIGGLIYVLSRRGHLKDITPEAITAAETRLRDIVSSMPGEMSVARVDETAFMAVLELIASGADETIASAIAEGEPSGETACFVVSFYDVDLAVRLAEFCDEIAVLLERWPDSTPRRPSKWKLLAELWKKATGKDSTPETWRRYDPKKKQKIPRLI